MSSGRLATSTLAGQWRVVSSQLTRRLDQIRRGLQPLPGRGGEPEIAKPASVVELGALFGLSRFDLDVVTLAASPEWDRELARRFVAVAGSSRPTLGIALELFTGELNGAPAFALQRLLPTAPLVQLALIRLEGSGPLVERTLAVDDEVWPRLLGIADSGPFVVEHDEPVDAGRPDLAESLAAAAAWLRGRRGSAILDLDGPDGSGRDRFAGAVARRIGRPLLTTAVRGGGPVAPRVAREAIWAGAIVLVDQTDPDLVERLVRERLLVIVKSGGPEVAGIAYRCGTPWRRVAFPDPALTVRAGWWNQILPGDRDSDVSPEYFAARYRFGPDRISRAVHLAAAPTEAELARACRVSTPVPTGLGARIVPASDRASLVLPAEAWREIDLIVAWMRHGSTVASCAGPGPVAMFYGPSGTGKTLAAQVLAGELGMDLLAVDLSRVVDKYLGETEKNLDRLFAEAEATSTLLFFDEADALFARRTDVQDAHDRYANVETGFLLQRLERHRGPVILATNQRANVDPAFLRRIHMFIAFALPDREQRARIWELHVPASQAREQDVDLRFLADRLVLSGGEIRNAAVIAQLLAAVESRPLAMRHLVRAAYREIGKSGRLVEPRDFGPWHDELVAERRRYPERA